MADNPFFSIVIPTKNRPQLLKDAIQSVLLQNFSDFELIVSDNHNDSATQDVIESFMNDARLKYVKPVNELNMLDHWEFASKQVLGKYVLILTDRNILSQHALETLYKYIVRYPKINCFSFGTQSYDEISNKLNKRHCGTKSKLVNTIGLIENFQTEIWSSSALNQSLDYCFPKSINSVYKNEYVEEIRREKGYYFNFPGVSTPDYSSFFVNSVRNKQIFYIGKMIMLRQGHKQSNGGKVLLGDMTYLKSIGKPDGFTRPEMINLSIVYNFIYNDFLEIFNSFDKLSELNLNYGNYFTNVFYEFLLKREAGLSIKDSDTFETSVIEKMKDVGFTQLQIQNIQLLANTCFQRERKQFSGALLNWKIHIKDFLSVRLDDKGMINRFVKFKYLSILEAGGFKIEKNNTPK